MTDQTPPPVPASDDVPPPPPPAFDPAPPTAVAPTTPPPPPAYGAPMMGPGPVGQVRSTGMCFLLTIVTLGIYTFFWMYNTQEEMKRHTGRGLGGLVAVILWLFVGFVMPFFNSAEVGQMQELGGRQKTVSGVTGLWILLPIIGTIIWFVKTNGALNDYWRSQGAQG